MTTLRTLLLSSCLLIAAACRPDASPPSGGQAPQPAAPASHGAAPASAATAFTADANAAAARTLPADDLLDFEDAKRGFVASDDGLTVVDAAGERVVWRPSDYAFVQGDPPPTVHPGLWRQARLNGIRGLFQVTDGVYQVRGYDLSNLSLIRGKTGWIVVDPLTSRETAQAALALVRRALGNDPVVAVIFTHSHIDHFGGIGAVLEEAGTAAGGLRIVAPQGFLEEATSENVLVGLAMGRRAVFMYGTPLPRSVTGHVDTGLGNAPAVGSFSIAEPTDLVGSTPQDLEIDGVLFRFQYTPASEAPAELTFYLPERRAFCGAEVVSKTMHNLYTLRGAKVRDALRWSGYIDEALQLFGDMDVVFASHHWPTFGHDRAIAYLERQRDVYRYIHDQTLRLANQGFGPQEIAEQLELPASLQAWSERGYYGTLRHNVKAVYQNYLGWYDANPAHLDPLPPEQAAVKYVEAMGGAAKVVELARSAFDRGEYRWSATLLDHLVFAKAADAAAKELLARSYEQLGFRAESGPWRDAYLTGAYELRHGPQPSAIEPRAAADLLRHLPPASFFDAMAVRLNGPKAAEKDLRLNFVFTDLGQTHALRVSNGVLHHRLGDADPQAEATVRLTRDFLVRLSVGDAGLRELIFSSELDVEGSRLAVLGFFSLLDRPDGQFAIVTP